jgi:glycosyltransferase involved in cell wall biosynthesis
MNAVAEINTMHATVAVIIPVFNRVQLLGRALVSVYAQTLLPDEVCVVDDGSTDGAEAYIKEKFPQVIYHYQSNQGVSAARNTGVAATKSHWLAFLDSDDEWLPGKLRAQMDALRKQANHRLVHCDEIWIRRGTRVNPGRKHQKGGGLLFERCLALCVISPSAVVLERELLSELGGFDESLPACEDYELWLKVCSRYPVLYVDEPLLRKYGGHEDQLSSKYWGMDRFRVQALDKLLNSGTLDLKQELATKTMLIRKSKILMNGAVKRQNTELAGKYSSLIARHSVSTQDDKK